MCKASGETVDRMLWKGSLGSLTRNLAWKVALLGLMWIIWRERNSRIFEGEEKSVILLKSFLLSTLYEWLTLIGNLHVSSFFEFIDELNS